MIFLYKNILKIHVGFAILFFSVLCFPRGFAIQVATASFSLTLGASLSRKFKENAVNSGLRGP